MKTFQNILKKLKDGSVDVDDLAKLAKTEFGNYAAKIIEGYVKPSDPELEAFLRICLDVYTYSSSGEVLIPDSLYDQCMNVYKSEGNETIVFADTLGKKWNFIEHEIPGVVGTISKVYNYKEFKRYLGKFEDASYFIISPKYDGISADIKVVNGEIVTAATRYNGIQGQDITALVRKAKNGRSFVNSSYPTGHYKCELCVASEDFEQLCKDKPYRNRRSATSGIINTPTNMDLAKYVTIIPLVFYNPSNSQIEFIAPWRKTIPWYSPADLFDEVEKLLSRIRKRDFPFRVDGVVITPDQKGLKPNEQDLMDTSIAYKVNTAEGRTRIKYGYMSVGRSGHAVPCVKVEPVEVNETIVEDVSLGSYGKFLSMDLKEGEEVIVYSAGDVIPQIKLPDDRENYSNYPELKIDRVCPYCGQKLERNYTEYACRNPRCIRVITGKIINFLDKMGLQGFSDKSVEAIYESIGVDTIHEFLKLTKDMIERVPGFDSVSAANLEEELRKIREKSTPISTFFGALGIEGISVKKCAKIFENVTKDEILNSKNLNRIFYVLQGADGIGEKTAETFISFIEQNLSEIQHLYELCNVRGDVKYKGNICFTGFRPSKEMVDRINDLGYEVNLGTPSAKTIALFTASIESESSKMKSARKKDIPIFVSSHLNKFLEKLDR